MKRALLFWINISVTPSLSKKSLSKHLQLNMYFECFFTFKPFIKRSE